MQGRYFIPLAPFIPLMWPGLGGLQSLRARGDVVLAGAAGLGALAVLAVALLFYWRF